MATRTPCPAAIAGRAIGALPRLIRTAPAAPGRCPEKERHAEWRRSEARAYFARRGREPKRRNVPRRAEAELSLSRCARVNLSARIPPETKQGALYRGYIACAVIDNRHFHSSPFVLGKTCRRRLSRDTAKRKARAKALNMAST